MQKVYSKKDIENLKKDLYKGSLYKRLYTTSMFTMGFVFFYFSLFMMSTFN